MQTNAYCIYDNKSLIYAVPFFAVTDGAAIRSFQELVNDASTTLSRHPGDYSLFCVGAYDDNKGELLALLPIRHVIDAAACVRLSTAPLFTDLEREMFKGANGHDPEVK